MSDKDSLLPAIVSERDLAESLKSRGRQSKGVVDAENLWHATKRILTDKSFSQRIAKMTTLLYSFRQLFNMEIISFHSSVAGKNTELKKKAWDAYEDAGIEVVPVKKRGDEEQKSRVDGMVMREIFSTILQPQFRNLFLFTGDSDYEPMIKEAKNYNISVIIISGREELSLELRNAASAVFYLEEFFKA